MEFEKLIEKLCVELGRSCNIHGGLLRPSVVGPILAAAFADVRREAIESAAKIVEDESIRDFPQGSSAYQSALDTLKDAADSVRALLPPTTPGEPMKDSNRCAVCGWPLAASRELGCVRGDCSMRPLPHVLYDPARIVEERGEEKER